MTTSTNERTPPATAASPFNDEELEALNAAFEKKSPHEIIAWGTERFMPDVAVACSFGGASGMAILDMALRLNLDVPVFYLDTDFLFAETYETLRRSIEHYGFSPVRVHGGLSPEAQAAAHGEALWLRDPDLCCELRKVRPQKAFMEGKRLWITGLRRDQGDSRKDTPIVTWNEKFGLVKLNPLANWSEKQVWAYIVANSVPYNALLDQGFRSIGCTHCTRAVGDDEEARAGRWDGFNKTECGLHT
jgi:phosphoadenosine phosphosulfate reductase